MARLGKRERIAKRATIAANVANTAAIREEQRLYGLRSTADAAAFMGRTHRNGYGAGMSTSLASVTHSNVLNRSKSYV